MTADQVIVARRQTGTSLAGDLSPTAVAAESSAPLLSIKGLSVRFGGILALDNVSFDVRCLRRWVYPACCQEQSRVPPSSKNDPMDGLLVNSFPL